MVGIIIVTHRRLGDSLIEAAEFILGCKTEAIVPVSINLKEDADLLRKKIADGIKSVRRENGVLILTDMFGGTPSNLSYSFLEENRIEVLSGVNLPIVIKAIEIRKTLSLGELAKKLESFGKKSISVAGGILKGNPKSAKKQP